MAVLTWGKPTIETKTGNGSYTAISLDIKQGTAQLETTEGDVTEALDEAGNVVDSRTAASQYSLTFQLYAKGENPPIQPNDDGIITDNYGVRLTPEDENLYGFEMEKCTVSLLTTWSSADGTLWQYTFKGLKPTSGAVLKPYKKGA